MLSRFGGQPSGQITVYWFEGGTPQARTSIRSPGGVSLPPIRTPLERWLTNLHRSLFLGDGGRIAAAAVTAAMLVLALSGAVLVARRAGGWRAGSRRCAGPLPARLHVEIARVAVAGLLLSSATALWMTASTFELLPDGPASPAMQTDPERPCRRTDCKR